MLPAERHSKWAACIYGLFTCSTVRWLFEHVHSNKKLSVLVLGLAAIYVKVDL